MILLRRICFLLVFLLFSAGLLGQTPDSVSAFQINNTGGYVIQSDGLTGAAGTDRNNIRTSLTLTGNRTSSVLQELFEYLLEYRVYDVNEAEVVYFQRTVFLLFGVGVLTQTQSYAHQIPPPAALDPYGDHIVRVDVSRRIANSGTAFQSRASSFTAPRRLYYFPSLVSDDPELNVIATATAGNLGRHWIVNTMTDRDTLPVNVTFNLRRFDAFLAAAASTDSVSVHFDLVVRESANPGVVVPLATSRYTTTASIASFIEGTPRTPRSLNFLRTLQIKPASGNFNPARDYDVEVRISHLERVSPAMDRVGNMRPIVSQRILQFTGSLTFGTIQTQFTSIANAPVVDGLSNGLVVTRLAVNNQSGSLNGKPDHTYGNGTELVVRVNSSGNAFIQPDSGVTLTSPVESNWDSLNGVRFFRSQTSLNSSGASSYLIVFFPAGTGVIAAANASNTLQPYNAVVRAVNQSLRPSGTVTFSLGGEGFKVVEEGRPLAYRVFEYTWNTVSGVFTFANAQPSYLHEQRLAQIEFWNPSAANPEEQVKRSNEQYWRAVAAEAVDLTIVSALGGRPLVNAALKLGPGAYFPHFPRTVNQVSWSSGRVTLQNSEVVIGSSWLDGGQPLQLSYAQACDLDVCGSGTSDAVLTLIPAGARFNFTADGGLRATGSVAAPLAWGALGGGKFAYATGSFGQGSLHIPGHRLGAGRSLQTTIDSAPSALLHAGVDPVTGAITDYPRTTAYRNGLGDYAGLNFRASPGFPGFSELGGQLIAYGLTGRSKYYARPAGITGIHEAAPGTFPDSLTLYGYSMGLSNYGLNFVFGTNRDSRTTGMVSVPYPSSFKLDFGELTFTCLGGLDRAEPGAGASAQRLAYWKQDFEVKRIRFARDSGCSPDEGFLALGVSLRPWMIESDLHGELGFLPTGHLVTPADAKAGLTSRLRMPSRVTIPGQPDEDYNAQPASDFYFAAVTPDAPVGFSTFAALLPAPFFRAIQAQVQIQPPGSPQGSPSVFVAGGWPNKGWRTSGQHFFNNASFDPQNAGFPTINPAVLNGASGLSVYRHQGANYVEDYLPRAQQTWLSFIEFDYPLLWNEVTRTFRSPSPIGGTKLLVLETQHEVKRLTSRNAEIVFGAQYDGLPRINLAGMAYDAVDDATGIAGAFIGALQQEGYEALAGGLDSLAGLVQDRLDGLLEDALQQTADPIIDGLFLELASAFATLRANAQSLDQWPDQYIAVLRTRIHNTETPAAVGQLTAALRQVMGGVGQANSVIDRLQRELGRAEAALSVLIDLNPQDPLGELNLSQVRGLLASLTSASDDPVRELVRQLIILLAPQLAPSVLALIDNTESAINEQLSALIDRARPTLLQAQRALGEVRDAIRSTREGLQAGGAFLAELNAKVASLESQIDGVSKQVRDRLEDWLVAFEEQRPSIEEFATQAISPFEEYSAGEFKALIRRELADAFGASKVAEELHLVLKQRLHDLDERARRAIDTAFAQINNVVRALIADTLGEVDDTINSFLGDIDDVAGAGRIEGYAHINGDALRRLRLDASLQLNLPDEMNFNGYLEFNQIRSDGLPAGCGAPRGGNLNEVRLGALDVPVGWLADDLRATVEAKFSFANSGLPLGFGGSFSMTGGEIDFEGFAITRLAAALAFGATENYISAGVGMRFSQYQLMGGVFFGRTCSLNPILLWDTDVAQVIKGGKLTGAYVYGEGWIPISEAVLGIPATCMFNISAGIGAGAFYFVEGPTFGGKLLAGIYGEALCAVTIKGEVVLVGSKQGNDFNFLGRGNIAGKVGSCPFCLSFSKSIQLRYQNSKWSLN
jgi:hypothetical protein